MKKFLYILILVALAGMFSPVIEVKAAIVCPEGTVVGSDGNSCVSSYKLLAPLPQLCTQGEIDANNCAVDTETGLGNYLNKMIILFIGICAVLSVVMIVVGGMQYMTSELVHSKEAGKERILHAILG